MVIFKMIIVVWANERCFKYMTGPFQKKEFPVVVIEQTSGASNLSHVITDGDRI